MPSNYSRVRVVDRFLYALYLMSVINQRQYFDTTLFNMESFADRMNDAKQTR